MDNPNEDVVAAINDLARVFIACNERFASKSEAIRRLHQVSLPSSRIADLLAMPSKDVRSMIAKIKKTTGGGKERHRG
jgi:hypothetical protein